MMLKPASREEWLTMRTLHVSSTESAAIFGLSPYMTAYELAVTKAGKIDSAYLGNERTTWGTRLEPQIADGVALDYGVDIEKIAEYGSLPDIGMGASFDYKIVSVANHSKDNELTRMFARFGPGVLEIKNVDAWEYRNKWVDGEAPAHIEIQLQHQLHVLGYEWGVIAALVGGNDLRLIVRARDKEVGASIEKKIVEFWCALKLEKYPPIELPEDADIIRKVYRFAEPGKVANGDDLGIGELVAEYADAAARKSDAQKAQDSAAARILMAIGDAEKITAKGYTISAGMVAETLVEAYTRKAYRNLRVYPKKEKSK